LLGNEIDRTEKRRMYHKMIKWLRQSKLINAATTGERQEIHKMENQTITIEEVITLSDSLAALPKDANQGQLAEAIANASLIQIAAVSNHGERILGSAERAVAAWFNTEFPLSVTNANWFEVEHRDGSDMGKTIAPAKKELYAAWKSSNPSVKYGRTRGYGRELAAPILMGMIAALPEDERAEAYKDNNLVDPSLAPVEEAETTTTTSRNKDLYERSVVELGKLYRALNAADNDAIIKAHVKGKELQNALVDVTNALKSLGAPTEDADLKDFMEAVARR
jgi:ribose 5-phosphate isomerase RpiB